MAHPQQVDSNVPRGKAALHAALPSVAFLVGGRLGGAIAAAVGAAMLASVVGGPRYSIIGLLYRKVIAPTFRIRPGKPEALAPHRFAEAVGAAFLLASGFLYLTSLDAIGGALALVVVALATLNAAAGICVGCQMYILFKRVTARRAAA